MSTNKEEKILLVEVREVYGRPLIYPVCEKAKLFAGLLGHKTLNNGIKQIKQLGYELTTKAPSIG